MSKVFSKKSLFVSLALSIALILAGAFIVGFLGFNGDSTKKDYSSVEITDVGYMSHSEQAQTQLRDFCETEIEKQYRVAQVEVVENMSTGGAVIRYRLASGTPTAEFCESLQTAIEGAGIEGVTGELVTVAYHVVEDAPYTDYIWRTAVALAVAFVIVFAYVAIRFRLGLGVTALIAALHDVLLMLAIVGIFRIPAGVSLAGVAVMTVFLSAAFNLFVYGKIRRNARSEEKKGMPVRELTELSVGESKAVICMVAAGIAAILIVCGIVGAFIGADLTWNMLAALIGTLIAGYSSLMLSPSIYAAIKEKWDAARAEKAKYNYASEKKKEKSAKEKESADEIQ